MEPLLPAVEPQEQDVKLSCPSHTDYRAQARLLAGKYVADRDARDLMAVRQVVTGRIRTGSKSTVNGSQ
jgi:nitrogen fixation protein FixH